MIALLEDYLIVQLNRDAMEHDLEQLHKKLDEFEQRLGDYYPAIGAAAELRREAAPLPMRA